MLKYRYTSDNRHWLGLVIFLMLFVLGDPVSQRAMASEQIDCRSRTVNDYLAPFDSMAPAHPPAKKDLRIGPLTVTLGETTLSRVISGSAFYGYTTSVDRDKGSGSANVRWTVDAELQLLNKKGEVQRITRKSRWHVRDVQSLEGRVFSLRVAAPGLYRFVLAFKDSHGMLKSFSQYVRGVRRNPRVAVLMDRQIYHAGEVATVQLTNPGTETISFGEGGTVSALKEGEWAPVLRLPSTGKKKAFGLNPGQSSRCQTFLLPPSLTPGEYRVEKPVQLLFPGGGTQTIVREFALRP